MLNKGSDVPAQRATPVIFVVLQLVRKHEDIATGSIVIILRTCESAAQAARGSDIVLERLTYPPLAVVQRRIAADVDPYYTSDSPIHGLVG